MKIVRGPESNCTAEYEWSFEKQSRNVKWPCLKWKLGCFILSKSHSYCTKEVILAGVIVVVNLSAIEIREIQIIQDKILSY